MLAEAALERLKAGNRRFATGTSTQDAARRSTRRAELVEAQFPFAVILGCSDSRVPAEIVFDQGLGDLFVIRVAGNIVAPSLVGSVEFAADRFGTRLVVVLGHTRCGAVMATLEELNRPAGRPSSNIRDIVDRIRPVVGPLVKDGRTLEPDELLRRSVRANVAASVQALRHGSDILEALIHTDGLRIIGAEYDLDTGKVELFDDGTAG
jgi:carbonic anhydrase